MLVESRSAWSSLNDVKTVKIIPSAPSIKTAIEGTVTIPGSKSYTNRAIILAGVADGTSRVRNILKSDDSYWCIDALRKLGAVIEEDGNDLIVKGTSGVWSYPDEDIYIGSAGTTGRFLTSVLALSITQPVTITASEQLSGRPMKTLFEALEELGAVMEYKTDPYCFPVTLFPKKSAKSSIQISGSVSSQFISGVLMASPFLSEGVEIQIIDGVVQADYIRVTLDVMESFGVSVKYISDLSHYTVLPKQYKATDYSVEADASTASYFLALAAVTGGHITLPNLNHKTFQPDIQFLDVLEKLGCVVRRAEGKGNNSNALDYCGVSISGPDQLMGDHIIDMNACSDTALTLAAIAPFATGPITITGVAHIRKHESDRISVMVHSLKALGVPVEERDDGLVIHPALPTTSCLETHDDHRVAMSLAILGIAGSGIELEDPGCVSKTCPSFFGELEKLGIEVEYTR